MKVLAISAAGQEFLYRASTAHKVSNRSAEAICKALNDVRYMLKTGEIWHVHEVDQYDDASVYADSQSFTIRNGEISRRY